MISLLFHWLSERSPIDRERFKNVIEIFAIMWGMMITIPLPRLPNSGRLRVLIVMWSMFCLHWYSAFTMKLYSNLTQMKYLNEVSFVDFNWVLL